MNKRIVAIILVFVIVLMCIVPAFGAEVPTSKTKTQTVTLTEVQETEENSSSDATEVDKYYKDEVTQEPTKYDNYKSFDKIMKKERDSQYEYNDKHSVYFEIEESGSEVRVSIHHSEGDDEAQEYFVYDENGKEVKADIEYLADEMVLILHNVRKGQKFTFTARAKGLDGIYITQQSSGDYYYDSNWVNSSIPSFDAFGYYNYSEEVYRTLLVRDKITTEQLDNLLQTYPLIPEGSLLKRDGVAEAFIDIQDEYGVSALGLLAIACLESAYGTSHIAREKQNLFGWGAVDTNPFNGAWDWSSMPTKDAIYKALELIAKNYPLGKYHQDCFYTMRWNNNVHQYCTSTTWPNSNARIRAQLEAYLGLR